jgi:hypothetical protein
VGIPILAGTEIKREVGPSSSLIHLSPIWKRQKASHGQGMAHASAMQSYNPESLEVAVRK